MPIRWKFTLPIIVLIAITFWFGVSTYPDDKLHLIACDVGQGDAILAVYGNTQVLIDGGPSRKVLDCLSRHIPFWDRKIEGIVLTHPQKDHYMGLIDVLKTYDVESFIATPLDSVSREYQVLKGEVGGKGIGVINPSKGMTIRVGLIYLDILNPSREFLTENTMGIGSSGIGDSGESGNGKGSGVLGAFNSKKDPNDFSVVTLLHFGQFDALLTGDIGPKISDSIADQLVVNGSPVSIEYLKVPHHGSKNGLSKKLLETLSPEIAVISSGKNNSYGHPHKEVLEMLTNFGSRILRTDLPKRVGGIGDVEVISDGEKVWIK